MPLSHKDQLTLLTDILSEHQLDCCGTVSECEQLERLVKQLLTNPEVHNHIKPVLNNVYDYSQAGQYAQHLDDHIESHKDELSQWVDNINQYY
ncbi:YtzH-like family protein [Heyndrickxia ginsengihumi]|uniref:YtzH-like protein n=2 Tax=Heyndrickxia ginsengihumi TaxID=363870 RepID=A0A0A6Y0W0_9BACI|nr:YtzH-like family protein [Heyndrickxia ginsengihumi]KHD85932.1 hypothetical protein NG54_06040 [Heyndrickxia ginsengihumi]MCM3022068.1 YtzH-like family protein [Heyndrickxia ginsengihumi]